MSEQASHLSDEARKKRDAAIEAGKTLSAQIREITRGLDFDLEPSSLVVALEELAGDNAGGEHKA